jgi:class 3 adenylate cyclase
MMADVDIETNQILRNEQKKNDHRNHNLMATIPKTGIQRQSSTIVGSDYYYADDNHDTGAATGAATTGVPAAAAAAAHTDTDTDGRYQTARFRQKLNRTGSFIGSVVEMNTTRSFGIGSSEQSNDVTPFTDDADDDDDNIDDDDGTANGGHPYQLDDNNNKNEHDDISVDLVTGKGAIIHPASEIGVDRSSTKNDAQHRRQKGTTRKQIKIFKRQQQQEQEERQRQIESLVSFSCHTPNAVLEDLIGHEEIVMSNNNTMLLSSSSPPPPTFKRDQKKALHPTVTSNDDDDAHDDDDIDVDEDEDEDEEVEIVDLVDHDDDENDDGSSVSSLSSGEDGIVLAHRGRHRNVSIDESEATIRLLDETNRLHSSSSNIVRSSQIYTLPTSRQRDSCLLFVDITGFTKLSRLLDAESLSRIINSYFDRIIDEVNVHGGDVLKFAGDALFVEWRVQHNNTDVEIGMDNVVDVEDDGRRRRRGSGGGAGGSSSKNTPSWTLRQLNTSLSMIHNRSDTLPQSQQLPLAVLRASMCAASIVRKYSDHEVVMPSSASAFGSEANSTTVPKSVEVLNVHCGIGSGRLIGFHVRDCQEGDSGLDRDGQEENNVELRREYLFLGDAIDQVSRGDIKR